MNYWVFWNKDKLSVINDQNSWQIDAFWRLRISTPYTLFDSQLQYWWLTNTALWEDITANWATITNNLNEACVELNITGTSWSKATRQTHRYYRYQPWKSQQILMTRVWTAPVANLRQRSWLFDDRNGIFFQSSWTTLSVVIRSYTTGSAVDNVIAQSSWNIDKLDWTGKSWITLDISKAQIFVMDLEWLWVWTVRFWFIINWKYYRCHASHHANILSKVYMTTANLPIRNEIENLTGDVSLNWVKMKAICNSIQSEWWFEETRWLTQTAGNWITTIWVTTRRPILSIRPKLTFNTLENRGLIKSIHTELTASGNSWYFQLVYNPTSLTGASFTSVWTNSLVEYDVSATAISWWTVIASWYVIAGTGSTRWIWEHWLLSLLPMTINYNATIADTLSLVVTSFSWTCTVSWNIEWTELY
jgi:hypothetical protein